MIDCEFDIYIDLKKLFAKEEMKATKMSEKAEIVAEKAVNRLFGRDESNKNS